MFSNKNRFYIFVLYSYRHTLPRINIYITALPCYWMINQTTQQWLNIHKSFLLHLLCMLSNVPLTRYVKSCVAHAQGMPGIFFPAAVFKGNCYLAIPACITARAWRTCRDACRYRIHAVAGKTLPAFPAHAHPQVYLSGKRPMDGWVICAWHMLHIVQKWYICMVYNRNCIDVVCLRGGWCPCY